MQPSAMVNDVRAHAPVLSASTTSIFKKRKRSEPVGPIGCRINARRFAAHQFGDDPSRYRPERETLVPVSKVHPELFVPRRASEDRLHVGHAGPGAEPWLSLDGLADVDQIARGLLC